jgi:hypothetical protein
MPNHQGGESDKEPPASGFTTRLEADRDDRPSVDPFSLILSRWNLDLPRPTLTDSWAVTGLWRVSGLGVTFDAQRPLKRSPLKDVPQLPLVGG